MACTCFIHRHSASITDFLLTWTALQRQSGELVQPSVQHLLHSSAASTPSGQQGSSSITDEPGAASSFYPPRGLESGHSSFGRPGCLTWDNCRISPFDPALVLSDADPLGQWPIDGHHSQFLPGAHGAWPGQGQDPLLDLHASSTSDPTALPGHISRPMSISPPPFDDFGDDIFKMHESLSSPVIMLPGSDSAGRDTVHEARRDASMHPPFLDPLWRAESSDERPNIGLRQGPGARRQNAIPLHQSLARSTSAPVIRRASDPSGTEQPEMDLRLAAQGIEFSIE